MLRPVYRLTIIVPTGDFERLLNGVSAVVPLQHGPYDCVAWWSDCTEQFRPLDGAHPSEGTIGVVSRLPSLRLELILPRDADLLHRVLEVGVAPNHPWEEPAVHIDESWVRTA